MPALNRLGTMCTEPTPLINSTMRGAQQHNLVSSILLATQTGVLQVVLSLCWRETVVTIVVFWNLTGNYDRSPTSLGRDVSWFRSQLKLDSFFNLPILLGKLWNTLKKMHMFKWIPSYFTSASKMEKGNSNQLLVYINLLKLFSLNI